MSEAVRSVLDPCPYCGHEHADTMLKCPKTDMVLELTGRILDDKFRFIRRLGRGGMASVWLALNINVDRQVAIKIIRPEVMRHGSLVARFRSEAKAAGRIGHAGVCEILDYGIGPVGPYIVMEHLQGQNLGQLLDRRGPMEPVRAVKIVRQALTGLAAAHARGIVHRDLKPENVFLHRTGSGPVMVKLMDFGVAKFIDGSAEIETEHGALLGTPEYMAPEQFAGAAQAERRTDIWAMGAILYRALTGRHAFKGPTVAATLMRVTHEEPTPLRSIRSEIPESLERVIMRCLSKDPEARYPNAETLDAALYEIAVELEAPDIAPPLSFGAASSPDESRPIIVDASDEAPPAPDPSMPSGLSRLWGGSSKPSLAGTTPEPTETATPRSASLVRDSQEAQPSEDPPEVSGSAIPRPDVELPDPDLTPASPGFSGAATVFVDRRPRRAWRGWAIAGVIGLAGLALFVTRSVDDPNAGAAIDPASNLRARAEPPPDPVAPREEPTDPETNPGLSENDPPSPNHEPSSEDEVLIIDGATSGQDPDPQADDAPAQADELAAEPEDLGSAAPEGPVAPDDEERPPSPPRPDVPPPPSVAQESPPGTAVVGEYLVLLEPGRRGDHADARKYCEALALTGKHGLNSWSLPNPKTAREMAATLSLGRGRYWTSARWNNRAKVLRVPADRLVSLDADRRLARPLCVAKPSTP